MKKHVKKQRKKERERRAYLTYFNMTKNKVAQVTLVN